MTHVMSAATTPLLTLAAQYIKHQAASTWLLPLSSVPCKNGATLLSFGGSCLGLHNVHTQRAYVELVHNEEQSFTYQLPDELRNKSHQSQSDHGWAAATQTERSDQAILFPESLTNQPPRPQPTPGDNQELLALYKKYLEETFQYQDILRIPKDNQLYNKFKAQIEAETRAARQSQSKYIKQIQTSTAGGVGTELGRSKRLLEHWSQTLQACLGEQLAQVSRTAYQCASWLLLCRSSCPFTLTDGRPFVVTFGYVMSTL
jgi:hypothetical protein